MKVQLKTKINNLFSNKIDKPFIVAEISANHNKNFQNIKKIIVKAKQLGIDAIKIQLYKADLITIKSYKKDFRIKNDNTWSKYSSYHDLYLKGETPYEWFEKIKDLCEKNNIICFSSVFDLKTVEFLEKNQCSIYKVASPEINDIPLLKKIALTKKPVIISTGLAEKKDLDLAIKTLKKNKCKKIIILKCTSSYPAPYSDLNLLTIEDLKKRYNTNVGFSDHTTNSTAAIVAVTLGACLIEKHIKVDNKKSLDSFFSTSLIDFKKFVKDINDAYKSIGNISYEIASSSKKNISGKKSLYVIKDIKKNEKFDLNNISSIRPSYGLHPKYLSKFIGKKSGKKINAGERLSFKFIKKK